MRIIAVTCVLAGLASYGLVSAGDSISTASSGKPSSSHHGSKSLDLVIKGHIKPRCAFELDSKDIHVALTDGPGYARVGFDVDCNQRMSVSFRSRNGALLHENSQTLVSSPGFTDRVPYQLEFSVSVDGSQLVRVDSQDIATSPTGGSIGVVPFHARGDIRLNWSPENPLIGGRYGDVIEIRVTGEGGRGGHS